LKEVQDVLLSADTKEEYEMVFKDEIASIIAGTGQTFATCGGLKKMGVLATFKALKIFLAKFIGFPPANSAATTNQYQAVASLTLPLSSRLSSSNFSSAPSSHMSTSSYSAQPGDEKPASKSELSANLRKKPKHCRGCDVSKLESALKKCSRCQRQYYCSSACQKADWKRHKKEECFDSNEQ